ncbi:MAG: PD40 domain-containing protein [Pirellulales bacterium]|nr:PD40 domain-containing protein [Pirellulales bacterium]
MLLNYLPSASAADASPSIESNCLKNVRQLTFDFTKAGEGYFSPDGRTIIYQAIPRDYIFYQIYTQPLLPASAVGRPAVPKLVSTGRGRTTCSYFAPDGRSIMFSSSHLDPNLAATEAKAKAQQEEDKRTGKRRRYQWDFDPYMDIFTADLDGKHLQQITKTPGYDAEGAYTPDGKKIVFCSDRDGDPDIYVMNADGSNVRQLTNEPGYDGGPFTSPDGRRIVYRSDRKQLEMLQIHVMDFDGKNDTALTDNAGVNWAPYWHPTKPYIIWTGADHSNPTIRPNYDLWLLRYSEEGGKIVVQAKWRITDHPAADVLPVFSPDGKKLMWTSNRTDNHTSQLFIADFWQPVETVPGE